MAVKLCRQGLHEHNGGQCIECRRERQRKYNKTPKGKLRFQLYHQSEKGRLVQLKSNRTTAARLRRQGYEVVRQDQQLGGIPLHLLMREKAKQDILKELDRP